MPCEAPEKRPSVMSAQSLPSPTPTSAEVRLSISGIPGAPLGPSYRQITQSPAATFPSVMP